MDMCRIGKMVKEMVTKFVRYGEALSNQMVLLVNADPQPSRCSRNQPGNLRSELLLDDPNSASDGDLLDRDWEANL
jgi:hypothetical protein